MSVIYSVDAPEHAVRDLAAKVGVPIWKHLRFDRLEPAYRTSARQFPLVLATWVTGDLEFAQAPCSATSSRLWLFALPNDRLILALTVEAACEEEGIIALLEDLHHRRIIVEDTDLWGHVRSSAPEGMSELLAQSSLSLETYNLLHLSDDYWGKVCAGGEPNVQLISSLIYRFGQEQYDRLSSRIKLPDESNRGEAFAATGPYVGVSVRNQGYVENAIFTSCLLFVGALMTLRVVRDDSFAELQKARYQLGPRGSEQPYADRVQRALFAAAAQRMARLQLELSCGVEAFERVASTVPSLRVTDFHEALFESAGISDETDTVSSILERITSALSAENERRQTAEREGDERRALIRSVSTGAIATVALPLGIVFGFFGMSAREVQASRSFLDMGHYKMVYMSVATLLLLAGVLAAALYVRFWWQSRTDRALLAKAVDLDR